MQRKRSNTGRPSEVGFNGHEHVNDARFRVARVRRRAKQLVTLIENQAAPVEVARQRIARVQNLYGLQVSNRNTCTTRDHLVHIALLQQIAECLGQIVF